MPTYNYQAKDQDGNTKTGIRNAQDEQNLAQLLYQQGLILISATQEGGKKKKGSLNVSLGSIFGRVSLTDKMVFTRNLSLMIQSGLNLSQSLHSLASQTKSPYLQKILPKITEDIRKGESFSIALAKYPKVFDSLYVNMIKVGESGGNLSNILMLLAEQMKRDHELVSRVKGAMIYPGVILSVMAVIGLLMMVVVVPQLKKVFGNLGVDLPITTRIVIQTGDFISNNIILVIVLTLVAIVLIRFFAKTYAGQKIFHLLFLKMPIISPIVQKVNSARFAITLSSLINSGISIVSGLKIAAHTLGNVYFKEALLTASDEIQKGRQLSQILNSVPHASAIFPPMILQMISVGEQTGNLSDILKNVADFYQDEVNDITKNLSSVIEPVLMVIIGAAVGFFAISMLQPMYGMLQTIG